ncbi:MAG: thioesterase domain-containing protein [Planctomycetaceae bacterium]
MAGHVFLIPGLGADADLFYPQQEALGDKLTVVSDVEGDALWKAKPCMSAAADAFAERILPLLPEDGRYVLGGMSFGGSLAMEIAGRLVENSDCPNPASLVLIASNRTSDTVSLSFRINRVVGSSLPSALVRRGLSLASRLFAKRESLGELDRERLGEMAGRADLQKLMWGAKAIAGWKFGDDDANRLGIPIHQLHGRRDWVIPIADRHVTETLENGRHLITWTHRNEVNTWLEDIAKAAT